MLEVVTDYLWFFLSVLEAFSASRYKKDKKDR